jgi:hypothetical protein
MKRYLWVVLISFFCSVELHAQSTTVSGTVTDAGSQTWNNGSYQFSFVPVANYNGPYTWTGGAFNPITTINGSLNGAGHYSVSVPDNATITPTGTSWTLTVCPQGTGVCYSTGPKVITGGSQTLNAAPPAISVPPGPNSSVYSTSEIANGQLGSLAYVIGTGLENCTAVASGSCSTWATVGGGGTPAFSAITSGTNTTASMVCGTGCSITPTGGGAITATSGGGSNPTSQTFGAGPSSTYTLSVVGGTIYATNNKTGVVDASGTDLRAVWDTVVSNSPNGGRFFFKNGTYNCNTLDQENTGGLTNYYCVGIPSGGTTQYFQWILEGETATALADVGTNPVQTGGVLFYVTPTGVSSVPANSKIMLIWSRPDVANAVGPVIFERNLDLRFPTNQRGCETASDLSNSLTAYYDNVVADFNTAITNLLFPVAGSCSTTGADLVGLTSTASSKQENGMNLAFAIGYNIGLDLQGEHCILTNSFSLACNHGIDYGVRGGTIYHNSTMNSSGWEHCARGLTLGANLTQGSNLIMTGLDIEDATVALTPLFVPVYHALETNSGNTTGNIDYTIAKEGVGLYGIANLFDGGGGGNFSIRTAANPSLSRSPAIDTFTHPNTPASNLGLGPGWSTFPGFSSGCQIVSNTARMISTGAQVCVEGYVGQLFPSSNQFSNITMATTDSGAGSFIAPLVNMSSSAQTYYEYYCAHLAATGSGIARFLAGAVTILTSQTSVAGCNAGDTVELDRITVGSTAWLYAYRNGLLDSNFSPNPVIDATPLTGGTVGFDISNTSTNSVTATNFVGGNFSTTGNLGDAPTNRTYALTYNTVPSCSVNSASPAACGAAAAGAFVIPTTTATYTVNTTAVTPNSVIILTPRTYTGNLPSSPTCVVPTITAEPVVSAISAGVSFTLTETLTTGQTCWNYWIVN